MSSRRIKDLLFRLGMFTCLGLTIGLLALLLVDVALDGAGHLTPDFITSFMHSSSLCMNVS